MKYLKKYKTTAIVIGLVVVVSVVIVASGNPPPTVISNYQNQQQAQSSQTYQQPTTQSSDNLSNDNYYTNSVGNTVHSPAYSNTVPVGASAQCRDGTYSFSQSRRGTCSHHGGVANWLY